MRFADKVLLPAALAVALASPVFAGTITGTVKGPDGAPFAGAFVIAENAETLMTVSVLSDRQGRYYIGNLPAKLPYYQESCLRIYDAVDYAENAFDVPIVAYSGSEDAQKAAADNIEKRLKTLGLPAFRDFPANYSVAFGTPVGCANGAPTGATRLPCCPRSPLDHRLSRAGSDTFCSATSRVIKSSAHSRRTDSSSSPSLRHDESTDSCRCR